MARSQTDSLGATAADGLESLEHRAEKWMPVFGKDDAKTNSWSEMPDSEIGRLALAFCAPRLSPSADRRRA
jgi:hypothetical protein